jgi:hypothetical protein
MWVVCVDVSRCRRGSGRSERVLSRKFYCGLDSNCTDVSCSDLSKILRMVMLVKS